MLICTSFSGVSQPGHSIVSLGQVMLTDERYRHMVVISHLWFYRYEIVSRRNAMPGSLRLGKIAGIAVYAHLSWFILLVLLTWSLASDWFAKSFPGWAATTYWIAAFVSALHLFVCVLAHELGHALVAMAYGLTVRDVTLFIFGGVASFEEDIKRPGVEFQIALAGPAVSMLLAAFSYLLGLRLKGSHASAEAVLD